MRAEWPKYRLSVVVVCVLLLLDFVFSLLAYLSVHRYSVQASDVSWAAFVSFRRDALDTLFTCLLRLSLLAAVFALCLLYATPDYDSALEEKKRQARLHNRRLSRRRQTTRDDSEAAEAVGAVDERSVSVAINSGSKHEPLLPSNTSQFSYSESAADAPSSLDELELGLIPIPTELNQTEKHAINQRCSRYRIVGYVFIFVLCTAMQVSIGVKVVSFDFPDGTREWPIALFLALPILFINLEQQYCSRVIAKMTREEGYLFKKLHPHKLFFDITAYGHGCDVCRKRIKESYRCNVCDFDLCHVCFARKSRVRGEGVIRGDKGVKEELEISSGQYLLRALKLARPHCGLIVLALACLMLNAASQLFAPNLQGSILDDVIRGVSAANPTEQNKASSRFSADIKLYIAVSVATGLFGSIRSLCFSLVGSKISNDVRNQLYTSILRQDVAFFDSITSGELTSRLARDTEGMVSPMQSVLATSLSNFLLLFGGMIMCFYVSWKLSILAITSIFPIIQITRIYSKFSRKINKQSAARVWAALAESSNLATQAITNIRTVRAFGTEDHEDELYREATTEALSKSILDAKASSLSYTLTSYLDLGTTVLLLWYGGMVVMDADGNKDDPLSVGKLITYWNMMNSAYNNLNSLINQFTKAAAAAQKVMMLSDTMPDVVTKHTANTDKAIELHGAIDIEELAFVYQMRPEKQILHGVNLHVPPATTCAFVGRSGGGKSTLIHLLLRFYDIQSGVIRYDGVPIDEWDLKQLRRRMAVVAQDTQLFATTIIENITYGMKPDEYTRDEVIQAAKAANAYEFIMEMEEGFDTRVGERGQRISGGQRQRLAICRAFMRRPKVLLLDEATSALDAESESAVQLAIDNLIRLTRCTVLLVAHRLSTVMNADQICVIDSGTISERGTHEQLLQQEGLYYALVKRQLARKANLLEDEEPDEPSEQQQQQQQPQQPQQPQGQSSKHYDNVDALIEQARRDKLRQAKQVEQNSRIKTNEEKEDREERKEG